MARSAATGSSGRRTGEEKKGGRTFYFRVYPQRGLAAHVVGYSTQARFRTGLERSMNDYLTGQNANLSTVLETFVDKAKGATIQGNALRLTLVPRAQRAAQNALGSRCGAVVALDVRDREGAGDVLLADVRPEPRRGQLRPGDGRHAPTAGGPTRC